MSPTQPILRPAARYFLLAFGAGFVLGAIRVPFVVPWLGEQQAELLEMPFMFVVILYSARHVASRYRLPPRGSVTLSIGFAALFLLVAAELLLGAVLQGRSLAQYLATRDPVSGSVYLGMLWLFALMPALVVRRGRPDPGVRLPRCRRSRFPRHIRGLDDVQD